MSPKDSGSSEKSRMRPVVYDYRAPADFLSDLLQYHKSRGAFSLRQRCAQVGSLSQALVSQILLKNRQLNRDNLAGVAAIFKLTRLEQEFLDQQLYSKAMPNTLAEPIAKSGGARVAKNHILSDWLHPYVKDLINLKGFESDSTVLHFMLQGLASAERIRKSVEFLLREGFWRRALSGKLVEEDVAVTTTNGIPDEKIKGFHRKALMLAHRGIEAFPVSQRKASTVLIAVDNSKLDELKGLIDGFQKQLLEFIEQNPNGSDSLVQVTTHLTPIGRSK